MDEEPSITMALEHPTDETASVTFTRLKYIIWSLPVLILVPLLDAPIPLAHHRAREIAGAYQSLAFIEYGLSSFTIVTPLESLVSLHLHSLLAAPFVAMGYVEGGRLVSLLAAIVAAIVLGMIGERLWGRDVGLLAPLLLWVQPYFVRQAYSYMPEAVSLALTFTSIFFIIRYHETEQNKFFWFTAVVFVLAVMNHMWEATILLPIVAVLVYRRDWIRAAAMTVLGFGTAGIVLKITHLQSVNASNLISWQNTGFDTILTLGYWIPELALTYESSVRLFFPIAVVALCAWGIHIWKHGLSLRSVVVGSWLLSGLSIHILLPHYHVLFVYSYWSLVPGVVLSMAIAMRFALTTVDWSARGISRDQSLRVLSGLLLMTASIYIGVWELGIQNRSPVKESVQGLDEGEAVAAGYTVRSLGVQDASQITFVGGIWNNSYGTVARVLLYAQIVPRYGLNIEPTDTNAPEFVESRSEQTTCKVMVIRHGNTLSVERC